jgi:oxygen-dependent protoporphyrinogen oxidase
MPAGMRLMVPTNLEALNHSPLFSEEAIRAYTAEAGRAEELRRQAPTQDESIASFVLRHFGEEVLTKVAAPLLSGVFGGDVHRLSVQAVMPAMVAMEREHGSLILALQKKPPKAAAAQPQLSAIPGEKPSIFTSLRSGTAALIHRMAAELPPSWVRLETPVTALTRTPAGWLVNGEAFEDVIVALPAHVAAPLLAPTDARIAESLTLEASSAIIVAFAFTEHFALPRGFGFLVHEGEPTQLLAATFVDQKFPHRVPEGCRLLRAFFGAEQAVALAAVSDAEIAALALAELEKILGPLPTPAFSVIRHWPRSLPQYEVGHATRIAELEARVATHPGLHLLGNALHGVGLPDLIRQSRETARKIIAA